MRIFLRFGVLGGTALALLAGLWLARRAMAPIAALTATARQHRAHPRPRPCASPSPRTDDEVAELARTLDDMLARARRRARGDRGDARPPAPVRRRRLARAAHAADERAGQPRAARPRCSTASRARRPRRRLRSSRRMRRLVADLLLLARADADRAGAAAADRPRPRSPSRPRPSSGPSPRATTCTSTPQPAVVDGARDELHRLALNLIENALRHTAAGHPIRVAAAARATAGRPRRRGRRPGRPGRAARPRLRALRPRRRRPRRALVRASGCRSCAPSRSPTAGRVALEDTAAGGARFVVRLPLAGAAPEAAPNGAGADREQPARALSPAPGRGA